MAAENTGRYQSLKRDLLLPTRPKSGSAVEGNWCVSVSCVPMCAAHTASWLGQQEGAERSSDACAYPPPSLTNNAFSSKMIDHAHPVPPHCCCGTLLAIKYESSSWMRLLLLTAAALGATAKGRAGGRRLNGT